MPNTVDLSGLDQIVRRLRAIENLDPRELMEEFEKIIVADNRRGVLAGLDKDNVPMTRVTYRPAAVGARSVINAQRPGHKRGVFAGFGPHRNNNLTSSEYRKLAGPPLAPRGIFSRVITNLATEHHRDSSGGYRWVAVGAWREVVSPDGTEFLPYHFNGDGNLPVRDLRGVRPEGMQEARQAARTWMITKINVR